MTFFFFFFFFQFTWQSAARALRKIWETSWGLLWHLWPDWNKPGMYRVCSYTIQMLLLYTCIPPVCLDVSSYCCCCSYIGVNLLLCTTAYSLVFWDFFVLIALLSGVFLISGFFFMWSCPVGFRVCSWQGLNAFSLWWWVCSTCQ